MSDITVFSNGAAVREQRKIDDITFTADVDIDSIYVTDLNTNPVSYRITGNRIRSLDSTLTNLVIVNYMMSGIKWRGRYRFIQQQLILRKIVLMATIDVESPVTPRTLTLVARNLPNTLYQQAVPQETTPRATMLMAAPASISPVASRKVIEYSTVDASSETMRLNITPVALEAGANNIPVVYWNDLEYPQIYFLDTRDNKVRYGFRFVTPLNLPAGEVQLTENDLPIDSSSIKETYRDGLVTVMFNRTSIVEVEGSTSTVKIGSNRAIVVGNEEPTGLVINYQYLVKNHVGRPITLVVLIPIGTAEIVQFLDNFRYHDGILEIIIESNQPKMELVGQVELRLRL